MTNGRRMILLATLPIALAFAGCDGKSGLSRAKPDSGPPVSGTPDTAVPANPDTAVPGNPDTAVPGTPNADAAVANLTVNPPSVDLGTFDVDASRVVVVTITNTGTALSGPLNVSVVGAGITASGCQGTILAPYATCEISIRASLTSAAIIDGAVEVGDGLANAPRISVTGIGVTPGPSWWLAPTPLDLGPVPQGKTVTGTVVMSSNALVGSTGITMAASGTGFSLSPTGTCTDTLAKGQSCNIVVSFTAGATPGPATGRVTVSVGGVTKTVQVTATVVSTSPSLQLTPQAGSFQTTVGTPSFPLTFYVSGDVSSSALTVTITGTNKDDFSFTTSCAPMVPDAGTNYCEIAVVYNPKIAPATSSTATLTVAGSGLGASASATLTGTAAGSTSPTSPVDRIPGDNTVSGWTIDAESNMGGSKIPMTASTMEEGGYLIDGGIDPFYADGFSPKLFIWQNYSNSHLPDAPADSLNPKGATLMLYVFRMSSADQSSGLYQNLMKFSEYTRGRTATSNGWEEPTAPLLGAKSRIQDTGSSWFINFQKNEYYVEIRFDPSNGPAPDFTPSNPNLKKEALRFAQAVAARL